MPLEAFLVDVDEAVNDAIVCAGCGGVRAPLAKPCHLLRKVQLFAALGFDDPDGAIESSDDEVGCVSREVAVGSHIVEFEADGQVVFSERLNVRCVPQKSSEGEFKSVGTRFADDLAEDRVFRRDEPRFSVRNGRVSRSRMRSSMTEVGGVTNGERVYCSLEGIKE